MVFTIAAGGALFAFVLAPLASDLFGPPGSTLATREVRPTATPREVPGSPIAQVRPPAPEELGAVLVSQSPAVSIFSGGTTTVAVIFRNTGTAAWVRGTPAEVRVGIVGDDSRLFDLGMAVDWPYPTRPAGQDEPVVEPGGTGQFAFRVKGTEPGRYLIRLAPVVDGVAWMDAHVTAEIIVR